MTTKLKKVEEVAENAWMDNSYDYSSRDLELLLTQDRQHIERVLVEKLKTIEEDVEIFTAFGYDTAIVKMIDPEKAITLVKEVLQGK